MLCTSFPVQNAQLPALVRLVRRTLKVRMAEHRRVVENKDHKNGIAVHVQKTAHTIN